MPDTALKQMYLIAEYCAADLYTGWHLYLRDNNERQQPNANGDWGWIRGVGRRGWEFEPAKKILDELGITITGDGSCDNDGLAEFARRFPIPRQRIGGKPRGCVAVLQGDYRELFLADPAAIGESR